MKKYTFEYTKMRDTVGVILLSIATFILTEFLGMYSKLNIVLTIVLSVGLAFLLFQAIKRKVVRTCTAKLDDNSISFEFKNSTKNIYFNELTSYKCYYGKNGPILYLKGSVDNFKIFGNDNFCKTDDFKTFCDDTIIQLDKYKDKNISTIIHEGSIFTKKGMLYFLIIATVTYLLAFFVETHRLRLAVGIGGGSYLLIMWTGYLVESKKLRNQNGS